MKKYVKGSTPEKFEKLVREQISKLENEKGVKSSCHEDVEECDDILTAYDPDRDVLLSNWYSDLKEIAKDLGYDSENNGTIQQALLEVVDEIDDICDNYPEYDLDSWLFENDLTEFIDKYLDNYEEDDYLNDWEFLDSKMIYDFNGFTDTYTLWRNKYPEEGQDAYVCVFGDDPTAEPDFSCETYDEAIEWFNSYDVDPDEFVD